MASDRHLRLIRIATWSALALLAMFAPAHADRMLPRPKPPEIIKDADPEPPPAPALCPTREVDASGELVERCAPDGAEADYTVRVNPTPFDTGKADWLVQRDELEDAKSDDLVALFGSATATIKQTVEEIAREAMVGKSRLKGGLSEVKATVSRRPTVFIAVVVIVFVLVFGTAVAWVLVRRARRHRRRLNAGRRTAAALMGELVSIRDGLRDLALDNRPGRLDDLERTTENTAAFASHQDGLRLIDRAASSLIIGFYRELRALPEPYIEERAGKLGTHRVLRLEAADEFATQSQALASRANELAGLLRQWLDENMASE